MYISVLKDCTSAHTTERPDLKQQVPVIKEQAIFRCFDGFKKALGCTGYPAGTVEDLLNDQVCPALKGYHHQGIWPSTKEEAGASDRCDLMSEQLVLTGLTTEGAQAQALYKHAEIYPPPGMNCSVQTVSFIKHGKKNDMAKDIAGQIRLN